MTHANACYLAAVYKKITFIVLSFALASCASTLTRGTKATADSTYAVAVEDLDDGLYPEALKGFTDVKLKFPYSKFAALADLGIADTHFRRGKFIEASDSYRNFLKYHPRHPKAAYAMFRIGEAFFEQIPENWWFLPPSAEKDQGNTRLAISAFRDMIRRYPKDELTKDAHEKIRTCQRNLADHEIYVARFYFERGKFRAAANRGEGLLKNYPDLGLEAETLYIVGQSHNALGDQKTARISLERLVKDFPQSPQAADAAQLLQSFSPAQKATQPTGS
ncbi:outer membrane protein assembly factor BamD [Myxococcota bacterium]|nr:outer membrane protein assembly factor BamD [Myxococcota bacterium]